jgi:ketosteroid isomerase-like protein
MLTKDIRLDLEAVLRAFEASAARGAEFRELANLLYDDEVILVGEEGAIRGLKAFLPKFETIVADWGGAGTQLQLSLKDPILTSDSLAVCFMQAMCRPAKPGAPVEQYRVLTAWKRSNRGWRLAMEMYTNGTL